MADYAHIDSLDALKKFRAALVKFVEGVCVGLDEAEAEIQRTDMWLKQEQPVYWKNQVALRTELFARAKSALKRKQLQTTGLNNRPSCVDELKELARAEQALEEARHKQEQVRRWSRLFEQEGFSYTATAQRLRTASQSGLPRALAQLDAMIEAIEAYGASAEWQRQGSTIGPALPEDALRAARGSPSVIAAYARLRALTPAAAQRGEIPLELARIVATEMAEVAQTISVPASAGPLVDRSNFLEFVEATALPPLPDDKVTLAAGVSDHERLYMERIVAEAPGDSGWHVGTVGEVEEVCPGNIAVSVRELLADRPFLAEILNLPPGWLAVLKGRTLEAVLDANDALRWYGGQMHSGEAADARPSDPDGGVPRSISAAPEAGAE